MVYVDTSVVVKLYIKEEYSRETSDWVRDNNKPIPITLFHELEFTNAIKLKQFRGEMTKEEAQIIMSSFDEHQRKGIYHRSPIDWVETLTKAIDLSERHTEESGSRSLDVLHVASALSIGAESFLTFDDKQSRLAAAAGFSVIDCTRK